MKAKYLKPQLILESIFPDTSVASGGVNIYNATLCYCSDQNTVFAVVNSIAIGSQCNSTANKNSVKAYQGNPDTVCKSIFDAAGFNGCE